MHRDCNLYTLKSAFGASQGFRPMPDNLFPDLLRHDYFIKIMKQRTATQFIEMDQRTGIANRPGAHFTHRRTAPTPRLAG